MALFDESIMDSLRPVNRSFAGMSLIVDTVVEVLSRQA